MNEVVFCELLGDNLKRKAMIWGFILLVAVVDLVEGYIAYKRKKPEKQTSRLSPETVHVLSIVLLAYIAFFQLPWMIAAGNDLRNHQFIQTEAEYCRTTSDRGKVCIQTEDDLIELMLPHDATIDEFPVVSQQGTVWYSSESKMILRFQPKTEEQSWNNRLK